MTARSRVNDDGDDAGPPAGDDSAWSIVSPKQVRKMSDRRFRPAIEAGAKSYRRVPVLSSPDYFDMAP